MTRAMTGYLWSVRVGWALLQVCSIAAAVWLAFVRYGPILAAVVAGVTAAMAVLLADVTHRAERRRLARVLGLDPSAPVMAVPDGYRVAYKVVQRYQATPVVGDGDPGGDGDRVRMVSVPALRVAAVLAGAKDTVGALWVFELLPHPWPRVFPGEPGLRLQVLDRSFTAFAQAHGLLRDLAAVRPDNLLDARRVLDRWGATQLPDQAGASR